MTINNQSPIPLSHLSKRTGLSVERLRTTIKQGKLKAVRQDLDENFETRLVQYDPKNSAGGKGKPLFVMPTEAERFIKAREEELQKFQEKKSKISRPITLTLEMEEEILRIAQEVKNEHPEGKVQRKKVLERLKGYSDLYYMIRYVLNLHMEECPPENQVLGLHARYPAAEKPKNLTIAIEHEILTVAIEVKEENPRGKVSRNRVLERMGGREHTDPAFLVRYVLDQHLEDFPPEFANRRGTNRWNK